MKLRVLHISPCFLDINTHRNGGVAGYIMGLAEAQAAAGVEVNVLYPNVTLGKKFQPGSKSSNKNLTFRCIEGYLGGDGWFKQLGKSLNNCDVAHIHTPYSIRTEYAMDFASRRGLKFIVHSHGKFTSAFRKQRKTLNIVWEIVFWKFSVRKAARTVVSGPEEQASCILKGPFSYLSNGFDGSVYKPAKRANETKSSLLYIGALEPRKNVDLLIRAFSQVSDQEVRLLIVGPDTHGLLGELKKTARKLECSERIEFMGAVYGDDKIKLLQEAKALVLLSEGEGMANVMMEAIGCNLPMVYSDGCVFSEVAQNGGGVQIPPNEADVTEALNRILGDNELRSRQTKALSQLAQAYEWSNVAEKSIELYEEILSDSS